MNLVYAGLRGCCAILFVCRAEEAPVHRSDGINGNTIVVPIVENSCHLKIKQHSQCRRTTFIAVTDIAFD